MLHLKRFESFVNDVNRANMVSWDTPSYNPIDNQKAKEFVESLVKPNPKLLFQMAGLEMPKEISGQELDELVDQAKEKAIEFLKKNPEMIWKEEYVMKHFKVNAGDGVSRVQPNLGGSSHANSLVVGQ
jgi:hypothetical protein